jgi:hypothetical protein
MIALNSFMARSSLRDTAISQRAAADFGSDGSRRFVCRRCRCQPHDHIAPSRHESASLAICGSRNFNAASIRARQLAKTPRIRRARWRRRAWSRARSRSVSAAHAAASRPCNTSWHRPVGAGRHRGGVGYVREIELLEDCVLTLRSSGHRFPSWGLTPALPEHDLLRTGGIALISLTFYLAKVGSKSGEQARPCTDMPGSRPRIRT